MTDAAAGQATFRVEPEFTSTEFAVGEFGLATRRGRFARTRGAIVLDPTHGGGSVDFIIDAASVATGWRLRDDFLRSAAMFDAERFPAIRFHSTRLGYRAGQLVAIDGDVELRGVARPVRLAVTSVACSPDPGAGREGCGARAATRISRAAFGMTYAYPLVGDEIELTFAIRASRIADEGETEPP